MLLTQKDPLGKVKRPIIPLVDPAGLNEKHFLTEWLEMPLTEEVDLSGTRSTLATTAPLRIPANMDLYGNSSMIHYIQTNQLSVADTITGQFKITRVYLEILGDLFCVDTSNNPTNESQSNLIGDTRKLQVALTSNWVFNRDSVTVFGGRPVWHTMLLEQETSVFGVEFYVDGSFAIGQGSLKLVAGDCTIKPGGAPVEKETAFTSLLKKNTRVVGVAIEAFAG